MAARGLLSALGGALSGIGQGMVAQEAQRQKRGQEEREARLRELERQQDQQFRTSERMAGQDFAASQAEAARAAQAERDAASGMQAERLQTQRLSADADMRRQEREAQANDPLRQAQAEYYRGGGSAGQKMVPVQVDDPDNPGQKMTVYKSASDAMGGEVGGRPGTGKAAPSREELYAKAAKIVDEGPRARSMTPEQRASRIEAEIAAMRGEPAPRPPASGVAAPTQAPAAQGSEPTPGAIPVPSQLASEPDGTIVERRGVRYKKQNGQLVPIGGK